MSYLQTSVGWLVDKLMLFDYRQSVIDILETERQYPGLLDDIATEIWQRALILKQVKGSRGTT